MWSPRQGQPRRTRAVLALVAAVLLGGSGVTLVAVDRVGEGERRYAGQLMDRYADDVSAAVADRVEGYSATVRDLASAAGAHPGLTSDSFSRMTTGLRSARLPGAASITFVVPATTAQIPPLQQYWRSRGTPDLTLRPAPGTDQHALVVFEQAFDGATSTPGLDLTQSPQVGEALRAARQSGGLAISPAYQLLRDRGLAPVFRQNSLAFVAPVYAVPTTQAPEGFAGWIVMPVRGQDFLSHILLERGQGAVQVSLTVATSTLLTTVTPGRRVDDESLARQRALSVGQRRWHLTTWPTTRLLATTERGLSRFMLGAGTALTLMLGVMTAVLAGGRSRALQQVDQATAALRSDIARREHVEAQLREREQELNHLAFHDPLTGLANRALFYDRLTHALATHARSERLAAVLFIDLDGFKQVNDQLGHQAGDAVLRAVAHRLEAGLRTVDTVARLGGDEFAILLEGLSDPDDVRTAADRVLADIRAPIDVGGAPARVSSSVGIATSRPGATADDLIRDADAAMYSAKNAGKNRYAHAGVISTHPPVR